MWYRRKIYFWSLVLVLLFLFTRLYRIDESLLFFNDIGRDFLVLWQWQDTGKPPLLGPQTSALPFNQSAIYFYLLYPLYWLSGGSFLSSLWTYLLVYVVSFGLGLYWLRHYPRLQQSLVLVFLLITVHPQHIIQGRVIWNPSFVTPAVLVALYSLLLYLQFESKRWRLLLLTGASLALAVSFSYSAAPLLLAATLYLLTRGWRVWVKFLAGVVAGGFIFNLPTLAFELRHGFLLTNMMLAGDRGVSHQQDFWARSSRLLEFNSATTWPFALLLLAAILLFTWRSYQKRRSPALRQSLLLLVLTGLLTLVIPVSVHSHYIFALLSLIFILVSLLERKYILLLAIFVYIVWWQAALRFNYFAPARQPYQALNSCAAQFCATQDQPLFVSNQSSHHPYHDAMEWQYLLRKNGCQMRNLYTQAAEAEVMAVILDDASYTHGETAYHELTLFGESSERDRFECGEKLEVVVLEKYRK
jgi:hypothetical protein